MTNGVQLTNEVLEMSATPTSDICAFLESGQTALSSPSSTFLFCGNQNSVRIFSPLFGRVSFAQNAADFCRPHRSLHLLCRSIRCCLQFCLLHLLLRWRNIEIHQQLFPYLALHADIIFWAIHLFSYEFSFINSDTF